MFLNLDWISSTLSLPIRTKLLELPPSAWQTSSQSAGSPTMFQASVVPTPTNTVSWEQLKSKCSTNFWYVFSVFGHDAIHQSVHFEYDFVWNGYFSHLEHSSSANSMRHLLHRLVECFIFKEEEKYNRMIFSAPDGCLQWYTSATGTISSFDYQFAATPVVQHIANQDYTICIRTNQVIIRFWTGKDPLLDVELL